MNYNQLANHIIKPPTNINPALISRGTDGQ